jgi:hypothetical protein
MILANNRNSTRHGAIPAVFSSASQLLILVSITLALGIHAAQAQTVRWVGPAGQVGLWSNPNNWSPSVPNANSNVVFDQNIPALVDLSGPNLAAAGTMDIQNGGVQFLGSGMLNVASGMTVGGTNQSPEFGIGSQAIVNVLGNLAALSGETRVGIANGLGTLNIAGNLSIGAANQSPASFHVEGGSAASANSTSLVNGNLSIGQGGVMSTKEGLMIGAGGTLGGYGTVLGSVTNSGIVSPGESIGELRIDGDFLQLATGELVIELEKNRADRLNVLGSARLGGTLRLGILATPLLGAMSDTISSGDRLLGDFERVIIQHTPGRGV